ncbi:hypothetical protein AVCANL279_07295 [Campylobacter canadensis]|uniref:hypothetical protein n=1 Tax=Campylobacter canadensis TaxID=449520 RepID=UPI0015524F71|nr:hypothetical protein [Campylobacter canadensis]MBZ7995180.1 hypothetical protein [Campylobacter canadensis]MBZ7997123.1 hypothetical protein [Campylobacter canadensis]MBZ8000544.1 hypothetical protein [Campylobacter canadensis]MBZ8003855.1 hypothetical protein [Campylobacter canadensis]
MKKEIGVKDIALYIELLNNAKIKIKNKDYVNLHCLIVNLWIIYNKKEYLKKYSFYFKFEAALKIIAKTNSKLLQVPAGKEKTILTKKIIATIKIAIELLEFERKCLTDFKDTKYE